MADYSGWGKYNAPKEKEPVYDVGWRYMTHAGYGMTDGSRREKTPEPEHSEPELVEQIDEIPDETREVIGTISIIIAIEPKNKS